MSKSGNILDISNRNLLLFYPWYIQLIDCNILLIWVVKEICHELPTNINNNEYKDNKCSVSLPNGLSQGSDLPNLNSNTFKVESIDQTETESPMQNGEESSGPEQVGSDSDSSDE